MVDDKQATAETALAARRSITVQPQASPAPALAPLIASLQERLAEAHSQNLGNNLTMNRCVRPEFEVRNHGGVYCCLPQLAFAHGCCFESALACCCLQVRT